LKQAKGYFGHKSKLFKVDNQAVMKSGAYAYRDASRRSENSESSGSENHAAARMNGIYYSRIMDGSHEVDFALDRKVSF
jgi:large subunit ribosomal protein L20